MNSDSRPIRIGQTFDYSTVLELLGISEDWDADDATLTCPCGYQIEPDGRCPEGCVSPLRTLGLI